MRRGEFPHAVHRYLTAAPVGSAAVIAQRVQRLLQIQYAFALYHGLFQFKHDGLVAVFAVVRELFRDESAVRPGPFRKPRHDHSESDAPRLHGKRLAVQKAADEADVRHPALRAAAEQRLAYLVLPLYLVYGAPFAAPCAVAVVRRDVRAQEGVEQALAVGGPALQFHPVLGRCVKGLSRPALIFVKMLVSLVEERAADARTGSAVKVFPGLAAAFLGRNGELRPFGDALLLCVCQRKYDKIQRCLHSKVSFSFSLRLRRCSCPRRLSSSRRRKLRSCRPR